MKKIGFFVLSLMVCSCSDENNCFSSKGKEVSELVHLPPFSTIDIPMHVKVQLIESEEYKLEIVSYENLIDQLNYQVQNHQLVLTNKFSCSMLHSYQTAFLKIYAPNLQMIHSRTQFQVFSTDTLHYPQLELKTSLPSESASSTFDLMLDAQYIYVEDNQVGKFDLKGKTQKLTIKLYGANGVVDARNLVADSVYFYHRSNQNIHIMPQFYLEGIISSVGNVYSYHRPDTENITRLYTGQLFYIE